MNTDMFVPELLERISTTAAVAAILAGACAGPRGDDTGAADGSPIEAGDGGSPEGTDASRGPDARTRNYSGIVVDHSSIALFDQIPEEFLHAARDTQMLFSDRSVGQNINEALDCLTAESWAQSPASCRRDWTQDFDEWKTFSQTDLDAGEVPPRIQFPADPATYDRNSWTFEARQGSWSSLTGNFIDELAPAYLDSKDVLSYQFSYLNVGTGTKIDDSDEGFFADSDARDIVDLEALMAAHPDKIFVLWTTSLARSIGTSEATNFNEQMRDYAEETGMILLDFADIESHTDTGVPCFDNVADGVDHPAICQDYTSEEDGGHLGAVSAGKVRAAKAIWVLMAQIAGWEPAQ